MGALQSFWQSVKNPHTCSCWCKNNLSLLESCPHCLMNAVHLQSMEQSVWSLLTHEYCGDTHKLHDSCTHSCCRHSAIGIFEWNRSKHFLFNSYPSHNQRDFCFRKLSFASPVLCDFPSQNVIQQNNLCAGTFMRSFALFMVGFGRVESRIWRWSRHTYFQFG